MFAFCVTVLYCCYIQLVTSQCPQYCRNCTSTNKCLMCEPLYWDKYTGCTYKCGDNCLNSECDDNGYCYKCVQGKYGPLCNFDCQLCKDGQCDMSACTSGCKIGYFQETNGDLSYCSSCGGNNCQQCLNSTYCTLCNDENYIYKYTTTSFDTGQKRGAATCLTCHLNQLCGECLNLSNCFQCSYDGIQLRCEHCRAGYTINNHECIQNIECSKACLNGCSHDGVCNGCIDGKTGSGCGYFCSNARCARCLQFNQDLCESCKEGFFTNACNISCPSNCATRQCDFNGGSCRNGCVSGFWGDKCEHNCSDSVNNLNAIETKHVHRDV